MRERNSTQSYDKLQKICKSQSQYLAIGLLSNLIIHFREHSACILACCLYDTTVKLPLSVSSKSHLLKISYPNVCNL